MLTGTPLDLTFIPELLRWLGIVIPIVWLLLLVGALVLAWRRGRTPVGRAVGIAVALAVLVVSPFLMLNALRKDALVEQAKQEAQEAEFKARYEKAEALFKKRCETAGELIYKTIPDVKGVVWMKWRNGSGRRPDESYQFALDDSYGADCGDESCIEQLLRATEGRHFAAQTPIPVGVGEFGYEYVEATNPKDNRPYRYAMRYYRPADRPVPSSGPASGVTYRPNDTRHELDRSEIDQFTARYGITWDDISTHEDRENWIAGGSITVIDLKTNEVIAKRVGYMMDPGMGSTAGFRDPWGVARYARDSNCPAIPARSKTDIRGVLRDTEKTEFLFKVLQPTKGENK